MRRYLIPACLGLLSMGAPDAEALARTRADAMPLGASTLPPAGFVVFCARRPGECAGETETVQTGSMGRFWSLAFQSANGATAYQPAPLALERPVRLPATPALNKMLSQVNNAVNRSLRSRRDPLTLDGYDTWSLPLEEGRREGDCEDFVLEKRHALIAQGVPTAALSIAVVETSRRQRHAVLIVATDRGELVLDSRSSWIAPWHKLDYTWIKRQSPDDPNRWIQVANG